TSPPSRPVEKVVVGRVANMDSASTVSSPAATARMVRFTVTFWGSGSGGSRDASDAVPSRPPGRSRVGAGGSLQFGAVGPDRLKLRLGTSSTSPAPGL